MVDILSCEQVNEGSELLIKVMHRGVKYRIKLVSEQQFEEHPLFDYSTGKQLKYIRQQLSQLKHQQLGIIKRIVGCSDIKGLEGYPFTNICVNVVGSHIYTFTICRPDTKSDYIPLAITHECGGSVNPGEIRDALNLLRAEYLSLSNAGMLVDDITQADFNLTYPRCVDLVVRS